MNVKALLDYIKECEIKGTVPTIEGLKQFHEENLAIYKIA